MIAEKIPKLCCTVMVLIISTLVFQLPFLKVTAQERDTLIAIDKPVTEILKNVKINTFTGKGFNFFEDDFSGHWAGFDMGLNSLLNTDYSGYETEFMDITVLQSYAFHLNVFQYSLGLQRNRNNLGLVTGVGLQMQDYRLSDSITLEKNINGIIQPKVFHLGDHQKSKLTVFSVLVPVLAEYQVPINNYKNRLYFSGGMFFGYRIGSYTKIKYRTDHSEKLIITGNYALNDFRYGIMVRTGYRWFNVYAMYELSGLYEENLGPEMHPFTFGITLLRF
jgi:hypothetical protein